MTFRSSVPVTIGPNNFGPPSGGIAIGDAEDTGTSAAVPHADHTHAFPAAVGQTAALAAAKADGTSTAPARANHVHPHVPADHEPGGFADLSAAFASLDSSARLDLTSPTATTATAGAATALPAAPQLYIEVVVAGTTLKIAAYPV